MERGRNKGGCEVRNGGGEDRWGDGPDMME
jgi:hypothetical protein